MWRKLESFLYKVLVFLLVICLLLALVLFTALEFFTPGQLFIPIIIFTAIVAIPLGVFVSYKYSGTRRKHPKEKESAHKKIRLSRRWKVLIWVGFFVIFGLLILLRIQCVSSERQRLLPDAQQDFQVTLIGDVSDFQRDCTITQLEKYYVGLRGKYLPTSARLSPLNVEIYYDIREFWRVLHKPSWVGALFSFRNGDLVISLPYSADTEAMEHELTHAVLGQLLGKQKMASMPNWFNEGLAEYESRGFSKSMERFKLWWHRDMLGSYEEFQTYSDGSDEESELFYNVSFELVLHMNSRFGKDTALDILSLVADGNTFEAALYIETYNNPEEFYNNWVKLFFN